MRLQNSLTSKLLILYCQKPCSSITIAIFGTNKDYSTDVRLCFYINLKLPYNSRMGAVLDYWSCKMRQRQRAFARTGSVVSLSKCISTEACLRCGAHQWNKLLETCCMKYEIFVWYNNQYISMEQRALEIYCMKLINCVACGNFAQFRTLFSCFSLIQMERIQQIA